MREGSQVNDCAQSAATQLLTVEEAAKRIHGSITANFVRASIHRGEIAAIKLGRRYFIPINEVERFLKCRVNANQPGYINEKTMALGSSSITANTSGQDMVKAFVTKQKKR